MVNVNDFLEFSKYLSVIHHSKNRIRLRANPKIREKAKDFSMDDVETLSQKIDGIKKIKVNKMVGSITIHYDSSIFHSQWWEELLQGNVSDELKSKLTSLIESKENLNAK